MQGRLDGILLLKHSCPVVMPIRVVNRNGLLVSSFTSGKLATSLGVSPRRLHARS